MNLGPTVNSAFTDWGPTLSHDGLALCFVSTRPGMGRAQAANNLWLSRRNSVSEPFGSPVNLELQFTLFREMLDPCLSPDGRTLFFANRGRVDNPEPRDLVDLYQAEIVPAPALTIHRSR